MGDTAHPVARLPRERAAGLSCWSGPVEPEPLGGGITNTNFVVRDGADTFVVRIGDDLPLHGVLRSQELSACRAAHACGLAPEIVHHEPGALVMRYVNGTTLTEDHVRDPETLERILGLVRRCHVRMPDHLRGATVMFWPFQVCRDYLATAREGRSRLGDQLDRLASINAELERATGPIQPAFCHNDLLPANFLDDGERLWLLDWEYAGWNTPFFDLANLASNSQVPAEREQWLVETYLDRRMTPDDRRRFHAVKCASLMRETLWSVVQEIHATLDFDFVAYTAENLARFDAAYEEFKTQV